MNDTTIVAVVGRRVWDCRGRPTVEAEVRLAGGAVGRAIAPVGAAPNPGEAVDLRDGGSWLAGKDVHRAVANVNGDIAIALNGVDAADQSGIDHRLIELDGTSGKRNLGGNATIAVSLAVAHAGASALGLPLWHGLRGVEADVPLPSPEIEIFGGGLHAGHRVDIGSFMIVCPGATSFTQAMDWAAAVYHSAGRLMAAAGRLYGVGDAGGWWPAFDGHVEALDMLLRAIETAGLEPGRQVALALGVAAGRLRRGNAYYLASENRTFDSDGLSELLCRWLDRYPIVAIEDPLAADDLDGLAHFTRAVGDHVQVVADAATLTSAERVRQMQSVGAFNAMLIKPNQAGTLTETRAALDAAREAGWQAVASARSGESEDVSLVHLAIGWGIGHLKAGAFSRSERMAKWNEALRIEEMAGPRGRFGGQWDRTGS